MIRGYILIALLFSFAGAAAQSTYTIKFRDKKSTFSLSQPSAFLSEKAVQRRIRHKIAIDSSDLPVNPAYVDSVAKIAGVKIVSTSKWFNHVIIETSDSAAIVKINSYPFVHNSKVAGMSVVVQADKITLDKKEAPTAPTSPVIASRSVTEQQGTHDDTINYGTNYPQVHIHEGEYLHKLGFRGQGISIAILDAGFFKYKTNPAFDSVRMNNQVLGEYDFVMEENSVDEDNTHGANCFSILAANRPGAIVGTAPKASYWLFRTEDAGSEKPVEELNWIQAAEVADSAGADMISSSLGYINFDNPAFNHSYAERDGNTTQITLAAELAAKKGLIVMNSAGNFGNNTNDTKYIAVPADADSILTVGAVNATGIISNFSSWGPTFAGKTKPNIVSIGSNTIYANAAGDPVAGNGTSYSNPNIAGLVACLWQAFPEFNNIQIIDAVQKSAHRYTNPDDRYGYGIPNFRVAHGILDAVRQQKTDDILKDKWIKVFPVPFKQLFTVFFKAPSTGRTNIRLFDVTGRILLDRTMDVTQGSLYTLKMMPAGARRFGLYFLQYNDGKNKNTIKLMSL